MFYCFSLEIRLEEWWKLICRYQSRSFICYPQEIPKNFNITSKHFFIFAFSTIHVMCSHYITRGKNTLRKWLYQTSLLDNLLHSLIISGVSLPILYYHVLKFWILFANLYVYIYINIYIHKYIYTIYMHIYHIYPYIYVYIYMNIYIYIHVYIYVYIYIYITYIYTVKT